MELNGSRTLVERLEKAYGIERPKQRRECKVPLTRSQSANQPSQQNRLDRSSSKKQKLQQVRLPRVSADQYPSVSEPVQLPALPPVLPPLQHALSTPNLPLQKMAQSFDDKGGTVTPLSRPLRDQSTADFQLIAQRHREDIYFPQASHKKPPSDLPMSAKRAGKHSGSSTQKHHMVKNAESNSSDPFDLRRLVWHHHVGKARIRTLNPRNVNEQRTEAIQAETYPGMMEADFDKQSARKAIPSRLEKQCFADNIEIADSISFEESCGPHTSALQFDSQFSEIQARAAPAQKDLTTEGWSNESDVTTPLIVQMPSFHDIWWAELSGERYWAIPLSSLDGGLSKPLKVEQPCSTSQVLDTEELEQMQGVSPSHARGNTTSQSHEGVSLDIGMVGENIDNDASNMFLSDCINITGVDAIVESVCNSPVATTPRPDFETALLQDLPSPEGEGEVLQVLASEQACESSVLELLQPGTGLELNKSSVQKQALEDNTHPVDIGIDKKYEDPTEFNASVTPHPSDNLFDSILEQTLDDDCSKSTFPGQASDSVGSCEHEIRIPDTTDCNNPEEVKSDSLANSFHQVESECTLRNTGNNEVELLDLQPKEPVQNPPSFKQSSQINREIVDSNSLESQNREAPVLQTRLPLALKELCKHDTIEVIDLPADLTYETDSSLAQNMSFSTSEGPPNYNDLEVLDLSPMSGTFHPQTISSVGIAKHPQYDDEVLDLNPSYNCMRDQALSRELELVERNLAGSEGICSAVLKICSSSKHDLHSAVRAGHIQDVTNSLVAGMSPNELDENGIAPLHFAAETGSTKMIRSLMKARAAPDVKTRNLTASHIGISPMLWQLCNGITPLHVAALSGGVEAVKCLLDVAAAPNPEGVDGVAPLHLAVQGGQDRVVRALLDGRANPEVRSTRGYTPLHDAADNGCFGVVDALLQARAHPDVLADDEGVTPLHAASQRGFADIVELLVSKGAGIDITSAGGFTPLHDAAHAGRLEVSRCLLLARANLHKQSEGGASPLHLAAQSGHEEVALALVAARALPAVSGSKGVPSPLHLAAHRGHLDVVLALRKCNASSSKACAVAKSSEQM